MKLRKAIKLVAAGAAVTASASVMAVPSTGLWSASGGIVNTTATECPSGFVCSSSPISETGFMQRQLTETGSGRTFIQTVLIEGDVTSGSGSLTGGEAFSDESFVEIGGHGGIIESQRLHEEATGTVSGSGTPVVEAFDSTADIKSGAFRVDDENAIDIKQRVTEVVDGGVELFGADFRLQEMDNTSFGGNITAQVNLGMGVAGDGFTNMFAMETFNVEATAGSVHLDGNYKKLDVDQTMTGEVTQTVVLRERTGAAISEAGSSDQYSGTVGIFAANDTLVSLRIGQSVDGAGQFGLDDFVNESNGTAIGIDSLTSTALPFQTITYTTGGDPFSALTPYVMP